MHGDTVADFRQFLFDIKSAVYIGRAALCLSLYLEQVQRLTNAGCSE